jgi:4-hydroxy-tetrahydrodipicolinate reductase
MNIITSSVEGSRPFFADPVIADNLDKLLRKHGVTYLGTGDSTGQDRILMALLEKCTKVHKIQLTQSGNSETLSPTAARTYGLGVTPEEYQRLIDNGSIARIPTPKQELAMLAERLGWQLDEIRERIEHFPGKGKKSIGTSMIFEGIRDGEVRIERISKNHPNAKRFCQIVIEGAPSFNLKYEVELCGSLTTVGCMVNAIPHVICAPPGIIRILDLPLSFFAN